MTSPDHILLSRFYQIARISCMELEYFVGKISNPKLQTIISNQAANYELVANECFALAKTHSVALPDNMFFKRCSGTFQQNYECITTINLQSVIACISNLNIYLMIEMYNVESATSETISIGKHLQALHEDNLNILCQIQI